MATDITPEQINQAVQIIKKEIETLHACRVGYAVEVVKGIKIKGQSEHHQRVKVRSAATYTNEYLFEKSAKFEEDWDIMRNPTYEKWKVELDNAKRVNSDYSLTRVIAYVGAISGIILLILRLIEVYNKKH